MDPLVFTLILVAIISVGRTVRAVAIEQIRRLPPPEGDSAQSNGELEGIREAIEGVVTRLDRMDEERDFYKDLLDSPGSRREISPPDAEPGIGEDATDVGSA